MQQTGSVGVVVALFLHSEISNEPMIPVETMTLVSGKGISGNTRYYDTLNKTTGETNRNHVSLIEREQIDEHASKLNVGHITAGLVRSNIETRGINLLQLAGCDVRIGDTAVVEFYKGRIPCKSMDEVHPGLQKIMKKKQGVIAEIKISGIIRIGDKITMLEEEREEISF